MGTTIEKFLKIEWRLGKITNAEIFAKARKPAFKLKVDFGERLGKRWSSAQFVRVYGQPEEMAGRFVYAITNFPPRLIAGFKSQVLVTGVNDAAGNAHLVRSRAQQNDACLGSRVVAWGDGAICPGDPKQITIDDFEEIKVVLAVIVHLSGQVAYARGADAEREILCAVPPLATPLLVGEKLLILIDGNGEKGYFVGTVDGPTFNPLIVDEEFIKLGSQVC